MNQKKSFIFILIILLTINIFSLNRLETIEKNKIKRESKKTIRNFINKNGELLDSIPSVVFDKNGNYYDLRTDFDQNGIANDQAYIHIYNKSGHI